MLLEVAGVAQHAEHVALRAAQRDEDAGLVEVVDDFLERDQAGGVAESGLLLLSGPNVMSGYLLTDRPGVVQPPEDGWYNTGDIVSIDFGVPVDGYHGDSALTVTVGEVEAPRRKLVEVTREALDRAIAAMRPGQRLSDIGHAVQTRVEAEGYSVVRDFAGHGIGSRMHEPPWIPNYGAKGRGPRLRPGMVFAVEPMVNLGGPDVAILEDEWTAVTADGSPSAHFEHTILITDDEPEVLTRVPGSH